MATIEDPANKGTALERHRRAYPPVDDAEEDGVEQDDFKPLSREQAQQWRASQPVLSLWRLVLVQWLVGLAAWWALGWLGAQPDATRLSAPWIAALVLLLLGCAEALQPLAGACLDLPGTASAADDSLAAKARAT